MINWSPYYGILVPKKMDKNTKKAYDAYSNQIYRCQNPKRPDYVYYGAKGIKVLYERRDFMGWYLWQLSHHHYDDPSVGRLDHSGNYCFENIEMVEFNENRRERYYRAGRMGPVIKSVFLLDSRGDPVAFFETAQKAAKFYGISNASIHSSAANKKYCTGRRFAFTKDFEL